MGLMGRLGHRKKGSDKTTYSTSDEPEWACDEDSEHRALIRTRHENDWSEESQRESGSPDDKRPLEGGYRA
jgi:hypothetical protein